MKTRLDVTNADHKEYLCICRHILMAKTEKPFLTFFLLKWAFLQTFFFSLKLTGRCGICVLILLSSSNGKYYPFAIVYGQIMKQWYVLYVFLYSYKDKMVSPHFELYNLNHYIPFCNRDLAVMECVGTQRTCTFEPGTEPASFQA